VTNIPSETDGWPMLDGDTVVVRRDDTLVGAGPPRPPVAPPPGPGADRRIGAGMLLALTVIVLAVAGVAIAYLLTHRDSARGSVTTVVLSTTAPKPAAASAAKVSVPRVVGLKEQPALVRLAQLGLRPKEIYRPTKQPSGVVVGQKPQEATRLAKGSRVTLVIDSGAAQVALPSLTGRSFDDAQAALDKLGLDSTATQVTSDQPAGTVVDQAPKPGTKIAKGSVVTLSVARAKGSATPTTTAGATTTAASSPTTTGASAPPPAQPASATVPDVTSQTEAAAVQALNRVGILASLFFIPGDDPLGTVEQQAKQAGTAVPARSHMQINVSRGPGEKPDEQVPNVVGQTLQQALTSINGAHLRLIFVKVAVTSRAQAGKVVQQSPLGGGHAPQNAQVVVFLGAYRG
jgi:serine/threonine-protein kinase